MAGEHEAKVEPKAESAEQKEGAGSRQILGNLPYTTSVGVLKRALQKIIESERPAKFNKDFLNTVFEITGGASMPIIPILKKTGMLADNGSPTSIYAEFQTEGGRANAALQAIRNGFQEIFKRNQYAHKAEKDKIVDLIVAITGLTKSDRIVGYIFNTFQAFQDYAKNASDSAESKHDRPHEAEVPDDELDQLPGSFRGPIRLAYQINIVLPPSTNIEVFNSIFKSLRENLLK
jgi:Family of unknown function (DUF5343)